MTPPSLRRDESAGHGLALPSVHWLAILALGCTPLDAASQLKVEPDGRLRYGIGLGASRATGNTESETVNLNIDAVRATASRKITFYGRGIYGRNDGVVAASRYNIGNNWQWELGGATYAFGNGEWLRDRFANLAYRTTVSSGIGRHLRRGAQDDWDVFGGLAYSHDEFANRPPDAGLAEDYGRFELVIGTESHHRPSDTTTLHQKLIVYPSLNGNGRIRVEIEAGVAVSILRRLALTATLSARHNTNPGPGTRHTDTLVVTGISFRDE